MRKFMVVALAAALAVPASLAYDFRVGSVYYNYVSRRTAVHVTYDQLGQGTYSGDVRIPYEVNYQMQSLPVTGVADFAFTNSQMMNSCVLPEGVTTIGQQAFSHCYYMTSVTLPSTVRTLRDYAFEYCEDMPSLHLPASLANIGEGVFYDCISLAEFTIDEENTRFCTPRGVLYTADSTELVCYPAGSTPLTYAVIEGTKQLREYSFAGSKLEHLTLPASLEKIGDVTFIEAIRLKSVASLNPVPPQAPDVLFEPIVTSSAVLYVPQESVASYRSAPGWSLFADIRGIEASTVVVETENVSDCPVYTLMGVKVADSAADISHLPAGIYVISGKVIVRN